MMKPQELGKVMKQLEKLVCQEEQEHSMHVVKTELREELEKLQRVNRQQWLLADSPVPTRASEVLQMRSVGFLSVLLTDLLFLELLSVCS